MRTFIAVSMPHPCREMLEQLQHNLRPLGADVRWVAVASIHLTLKFLGEMEPKLLPHLVEMLRASAGPEPAFSLRLHGLGGFPNLRNPRVIWCGIEGDIERLTRLQEKVESACSELGFAREERSFHPHLTLGRVNGKRNLQVLLDYIKIGTDQECAFAVNHFNVYRSTLAPRGAIYDILATVPLNK
jgi:RNA 2',3'-cyclic 3'-phosphodiesterase